MKIRKNKKDIRWIFWDLGQVLLAYLRLVVHLKICRMCGENLSLEEMRRRLLGSSDRMTQGSVLYDANMGYIDTTEFIAAARRVLSIRPSVSDAEFFSCYDNCHEMSAEIRTLLYFFDDETKGGIYFQGIISNIPEFNWQDVLRSFLVLNLKEENPRGVMRVHIPSFALHLMKPDPIIYACALSAAREVERQHGVTEPLLPQNCLFFDDLPENVASARDIGMHSCLVEGERDEERGGCFSYRNIAEQLLSFGIDLPPQGYYSPRDT